MPPQPILIEIKSANINSTSCGGIKDPNHPGLAAKRAWLQTHLSLGLKAKTLIDEDGSPCGYIEYLPGEYAWRGVEARGYMFIHCIWNHSQRNRGKGWGSAMINSCISDARATGMHGVAAMTRKGPWLAGAELFHANDFRLVDTASPDYQLWVRKLNPNVPDPAFRKDHASKAACLKDELTIVCSSQCPYVAKFTAEISEAAQRDYGMTPTIVELKSHRDAQDAPTPYAVFSILSCGRVLTDHQISRTRFHNIMRSVCAKTRGPFTP